MDDIALFGQASGDANPLHQSVEFARATPFGEPIAHGMLGVIAAFDEEGEVDLSRGKVLEAQFLHPLIPGISYRAAERQVASRSGRLTVWHSDQRCVEITVKTGESLPSPSERRPDSATTAVGGEYRPAAKSVSELARRWPRAFSRLGHTGFTAICWCSFVAGMRLPGRFGVLCHARIRLTGQAAGPADGLCYHADLVDLDERFGLVTVGGQLWAGDQLLAQAAWEAMVTRPVATPALSVIDRTLPASRWLQGKTAVVVGGSRGLGAGLALALAGQGCQVIVGHRGAASALAPLNDQLAGRGGALVSLPGDAGDASWAARVRRCLTTTGASLDFLVLNAFPVIGQLRFTAAEVTRIASYVASALDLVTAPLLGLADLLEAARGRCLLVSSAALDDLPAQWPHYVAAKAAAEGVLTWMATNHPAITCFAVRPGIILTDQTNVPGYRDRAHAVEPVAAQICRDLAAAGPGTGRLRRLRMAPTECAAGIECPCPANRTAVTGLAAGWRREH